ncbi:GNAT family N-acetyltransferase [Sphingomonas jatrophae]|uniref:GNAT family N-acetyltransferase n=1 Tax=Sphingomonas jatrophae TaxID=1166337 RepID=UPI00310184B6
MIRRAGVEDAPALALVGAATFLEGFATLIPGADIVAHTARNHSADAYRAYLAQPVGRAWLAETETGAPVGYALMCEPELPQAEPGDIEMKRFYLFSRWHGSGAARSMSNAMLAEARALGRRRLLIGTHHDNMRAIGFYRKIGAERIGGRRFEVGGSVFDDHVYAITL